MDLNDYQANAAKTALVDEHVALSYNIIAIAGEAGELAGKLSKTMRDPDRYLVPSDVAKELGDVLWHVSEAARALGYTLNEIAVLNLYKLQDRSLRNTLIGDGDNR